MMTGTVMTMMIMMIMIMIMMIAPFMMVVLVAVTPKIWSPMMMSGHDDDAYAVERDAADCDADGSDDDADSQCHEHDNEAADKHHRSSRWATRTLFLLLFCRLGRCYGT